MDPSIINTHTESENNNEMSGTSTADSTKIQTASIPSSTSHVIDASSCGSTSPCLLKVENELSLSYRILTRHQLDDNIIQQCAELFSSHYGIWSSQGPAPNQRVKLSMQKLKEKYLFDENTYIVVVTNLESEKVIGHAIGKRFLYPELEGTVSWITQLVVHSDFRNKGISTRLCTMAWGHKNNVACGLVTSHPYSIRALEKSTNCIIDMEKILLHGSKLIEACQIPYLLSAETFFNESRCVLNTQFYVSHEEINKIIRETDDWNLGEVKDGEEFFAVCFPMNKRRRLSSNCKTASTD